MDEGLINSKEVAAMIGISHYTFCDWRSDGKDVPPGYFLNGKYRYRRNEVEAWITSHPRSRK